MAVQDRQAVGVVVQDHAAATGQLSQPGTFSERLEQLVAFKGAWSSEHADASGDPVLRSR